MVMKLWGLVLSVMLATVLLSACSQSAPEMRNGYYTAQTTSFDAQGWKEFITIYVSNNKIVTVEYNAKNASGFIKSWDIDHMRAMKAMHGTYPSESARAYSIALLNRQDAVRIDAVPGAARSHTSFQLLAAAAIAQAKAGDRHIAYVELPDIEE